MIIDLHTQVWSNVDQLGREQADAFRAQQAERWGQFDASTAAHEQAMTCVDASVVLGFRSDRMGASIPNEYVAQFVAQDPQRRIGVAGIDPLSDDADDQFQAAIDMGFVGVTIAPACQGFHPMHSGAQKLYERCLEAGMPIFITMDGPLTASFELEFARPFLLDEVARTYPDLRMVIGQLGHPWIDETLVLLSKHEHVYADLTGVSTRPWQLYNALLHAVSFRAMNKLFFGSGFPRETPAKAIETLYSVNSFSHGTQLPSVPRAHIREIIERDSLALLGIDAEIAERNVGDVDVEQWRLPARSGAASEGDSTRQLQ